MESLEFDEYFKPQIRATYEMCFGHLSKASLGSIFGTTEERQGYIYPHIFLHSTFYIFFLVPRDSLVGGEQ